MEMGKVFISETKASVRVSVTVPVDATQHDFRVEKINSGKVYLQKVKRF
jgi:hypothetical protein